MEQGYSLDSRYSNNGLLHRVLKTFKTLDEAEDYKQRVLTDSENSDGTYYLETNVCFITYVY